MKLKIFIICTAILTIFTPLCSCQPKVTLHKHLYSSWEEISMPMCESDGEFVRRCKECEHSESKTAPALGHAYDDGYIIIAPTCTQRGQKNYSCRLCGKVKETIASKAPHTPLDEYTVTETHHGFLCKDCGTLTSKEEHFFGNDGLCIICKAPQT